MNITKNWLFNTKLNKTTWPTFIKIILFPHPVSKSNPVTSNTLTRRRWRVQKMQEEDDNKKKNTSMKNLNEHVGRERWRYMGRRGLLNEVKEIGGGLYSMRNLISHYWSCCAFSCTCTSSWWCWSCQCSLHLLCLYSRNRHRMRCLWSPIINQCQKT